MSENLALRRRVGERLGWRVEKSPSGSGYFRWRRPDGEVLLWASGEPAEHLPRWECSLDAALAGDGPGGWLAEQGWAVNIHCWPIADGNGNTLDMLLVGIGGSPSYADAGQRGQEARLLCELFERVTLLPREATDGGE
ncbi:MAG: hypothetical protein V2A73_08780 [Pseudomonadota bacterium]